ncbi:hypothetical protein NQ176_g4936 [Zarea fungicola]|uniref:Uncharacterized protein n=1 Tax=Zarea fungicola TaxID=93591 RepID=A0ACC1NBW7_9HYPO|nr:hypothetical protein NQ176_g4936 [Lecanicillium fungicola]
MTFQIAQIFDDTVARAALQKLDYNDVTHATDLLTCLDEFLKDYVTGDEVNGTEPYNKDEDAEALADISTAWLDDAEQGKQFWPHSGPSNNPRQLCYDDGAHPLITDLVQDLICALNSARQSIAGGAQCTHNPTPFEPKVSWKRYSAIAQAKLIIARKNADFWVRRGLSDEDLCRVLSPLLDSTGRAIDTSLDSLSIEFQIQLRSDKVADLPQFFFPLQHHASRSEQVEIATSSLNYLETIGIVSEIGHSDEERLHAAAEACGDLCFRNCYELPKGLDDATMFDLLAKFVIMELGRGTVVANKYT